MSPVEDDGVVVLAHEGGDVEEAFLVRVREVRFGEEEGLEERGVVGWE